MKKSFTIVENGGKRYYSRSRKDYLDSIIEIIFDEYQLEVYPGNRGDRPECDILVVYRRDGKNQRQRVPKHAHWAVDLLIKMQHEESKTKEFIEEMLKEWEKCPDIKNRDEVTLKTIVSKEYDKINVNEYNELNDYGEYKMDFLTVLLILIMAQEKTSNPNARMFKGVLESLLEDSLDLFAIISSASFSGGNK